jgi:hypothetical protein
LRAGFGVHVTLDHMLEAASDAGAVVVAIAAAAVFAVMYWAGTRRH